MQVLITGISTVWEDFKQHVVKKVKEHPKVLRDNVIKRYWRGKRVLANTWNTWSEQLVP